MNLPALPPRASASNHCALFPWHLVRSSPPLPHHHPAVLNSPVIASPGSPSSPTHRSGMKFVPREVALNTSELSGLATAAVSRLLGAALRPSPTCAALTVTRFPASPLASLYLPFIPGGSELSSRGLLGLATAAISRLHGATLRPSRTCAAVRTAALLLTDFRIQVHLFDPSSCSAPSLCAEKLVQLRPWAKTLSDITLHL